METMVVCGVSVSQSHSLTYLNYTLQYCHCKEGVNIAQARDRELNKMIFYSLSSFSIV